ncbi:tetratricopeptide repeat protein [bacterium]|nr:tetratricopeptide repeat protein [bacterium]
MRPRSGTRRGRFWVLALVLLVVAGCAKYNTFFNAKRSFEDAEAVREDYIKRHEDPPRPAGAQRADYEAAIRKSQKILDEYPGHSLTDDALFLQAKAHHRLEAYRQSIRKLNLLFQNFPATEYEEEALYIQALNYLLIGAVDSSQEYLDRLARNFPDSRYQAETRRVSGDNAYSLERWEEAAEAYREYLKLDSDRAERDRIGLKLAECYWELGEYYPAAEILQDVSQETASAELGFRARLLRGRVHVRMNDFEIVELLVRQLRAEAEIYQAQGEVALLEAESLIAQGKIDEAAPLLENMPTEWETPEVKARAAEIMGDVYLSRGEWEQSREKFTAAVARRDALDDEEHVRRMNETLKDFLAAEQALPDAKGERVAQLKLLQANALLFGFERPHMAASLYAEAAADTAADDAIAARALYGGFVTYRDHLALPDSAAIFRGELTARYPESPQAYEAATEGESNLYGYLLELRSGAQAENYAALTPEERQQLTVLEDVTAGLGGGTARTLPGVRRRMVYLARRANILYEPPTIAIEQIAAEQAAKVRAAADDAARQAEFDSLRAAGQAAPDPAAGAAAGAAIGGTAGEGVGSATPVGGDPVDAAAGTESARDGSADAKQDGDKKDGDKQDDKKDDKKKKKDDDWDYLR